MNKDEEYTALISPDAYSYLDDTPEEELLHDELLEEQESLEDMDLQEEDESNSDIQEDDSVMYSAETLFDAFNRSLISTLMSFISENSDVYSYLASCNEKTRSEIEAVLKKAEEARKADGKDKMFAIPDTSITVAVVSGNSDPVREAERLKTVAAVMVSQSQDSRNLLSVAFEDDGSVSSAETHIVTKDLFTDNEWNSITKLAERFKK